MTTETIARPDVVASTETKVVEKVETRAPDKVETKVEQKSEQSDWRKSIAESRAKGDEAQATKILKRLERFSDPGVIFDSLEQTQRELHESGRIKLPGKEASDEDKTSFAKALGVPDKPEGYAKLFKLELPEGVALDENDQAQLKNITEYLHGKGGFAASPDVVKAAQELYVEMRENAQAGLVASAQEAKMRAEQALKEEWGNEYKPNLQFTSQGLTALAGRDAGELSSVQLADGSLLGDNPLFVKAMMQAGRLAGQDPLLWAASQMGGTPSSLKERKNEIMKMAYGNPDEVKEYNRLAGPGGELEAIITKLDNLAKS